MNINLDEAKKLENHLSEKLEKVKIKGIDKYNLISEETKRYYLSSSYAKEIYKYFYGETKDNTNLIENFCTSCYYSIESYYTPCTINVVVIELQAGKNLSLSKENYIVSAVENLGDFLEHTKKYDETTLIKTSKYLYRIYYSLYKATNKVKYLNMMKEIKENIIPLRGKKIDKIPNNVKNFLTKENIDKQIKEIVSELKLII